MTLASAADVSRIAADLVLSDRPPKYQDMDCKAFVEHCVRQAGGQMQYAGSNDMFRNACTHIVPLRQAVVEGQLRSGWLLFILEQDGGEPAQYRQDGIGNASHVGLYTDMHVTYADGRKEYVEVAHSSKSKGGVVASTLANGWTYAGPAKAVDYGVWGGAAGEAAQSPQDGPGQPGGSLSGVASQGPTWAVVTDSSVNLRKTPAGEYQMQIPNGAKIPVYEKRTVSGKQYGRTEYANHNGQHRGWIDMAYVQVMAEEAAGGSLEDEGAMVRIEIVLPRGAALETLARLKATLGVD